MASGAVLVQHFDETLVEALMFAMAGTAALGCNNPVFRLRFEVSCYRMASSIALLVVQSDVFNAFAAPCILSDRNVLKMAVFTASLVPGKMRFRKIARCHVKCANAREYPSRIDDTYDQANNSHPSLAKKEWIERGVILPINLCCALPAVFLHWSP